MERSTYPTRYTISIHALVKRATERHAGGVITDEISIHALVKRATALLDDVGELPIFQSTPS